MRTSYSVAAGRAGEWLVIGTHPDGDVGTVVAWLATRGQAEQIRDMFDSEENPDA